MRKSTRARYTPEQAEAAIVPKIVDAIYPVLIPVEQQDCKIQAENNAQMTRLATQLWRAFVGSNSRG